MVYTSYPSPEWELFGFRVRFGWVCLFVCFQIFFPLKFVVLSLLLSYLRIENSLHNHCHPDYRRLPILNQFFSISLDEIYNQCSSV